MELTSLRKQEMASSSPEQDAVVAGVTTADRLWKHLGGKPPGRPVRNNLD